MASLLLMNTSGPVLFDGEAIAYVSLNGTNAYIELPKLPGNHQVIYGENEENYHIFDTVCSAKGAFSCNVSANENIELDYMGVCGSTKEGVLNLRKGETREILIKDECNTAKIQVGDWKKEFDFTRVYKNFISFDGEVNLTVKDGDKVVLQKWGKDYISFPELSPGEYRFESDKFHGTIIIEPLRSAIYGYFFAAILVLGAVGLLWLG